MKRTAILLALALAVSACTAEKFNCDNDTKITVEAVMAESDLTRTVVLDNTTTVLWEPGDEIKLFFNGNGSRLTSSLTAPAGVSSFSGTFNGVISFSEGFSDATPLWGLYPYRADATADNKSVTTTLPSEQTGRAGSFAKGTFITLAKSHDLKMGFYNVCGGVRFSLVNDNIKEVVLEGRNGEDLAGKVKLTFDGNYPVVSEVLSGGKSITLTAPNGGCFEKGEWYYIVVLPGTLSNGFKLTLNTADKYAVRESSSSVTVKRGVFGNLEDVDKGLVFIDKGEDPHGGNIVFKDSAAKFACVMKYDTNGDGEVSIAEAEAATSFDGLFTDWKTVASFDEIKYFKNVHSIDGLFEGCSKLESITIPENITELGTSAFSGCSSLTSVILPAVISAIGKYTFGDCSKLASIEIPSGVTSIDDGAFYNCTSLSSIDLPPLLSSIGIGAFADCSALKQIVIPENVTSLGLSAFASCFSLISANIPSGISTIPYSCFSDCSSLTSVTIPESVTSIGDFAFSEVNMWSLKLPASVKSLGHRCFEGITCIVLPSTSPVSIENGTFAGVKAIFVPSSLIEMYRAMTDWSDYSSNLHPLSLYKEEEDFFSSSVLGTSGAVDMGTSVKWAACNLDAGKPEGYGGYYQWGGLQDVTAESYYLDWDNCPYHTGSSEYGGWTKYVPLNASSYWSGSGNPDNKTVLDPEDDVAHVKLGGKWRMPTDEEFGELVNACLWEWTTHEGANGYMVYSFVGNRIFLPAAGWRSGDGLYDVGSRGYYWSSSLSTDYPDEAYYMSFRSGDVYTSDNDRYDGRSVRPVSE